MKASHAPSLAVLLVALAAPVLVGCSGSKSEVPPEKVRRFLCVNQDCAKAFADDDLNLDDAAPYGNAGAMALKCPACGKHTVFAATQCAHCGTAYVPTRSYRGPAGDLKCPKCGKAPR